MVKIIIPTGLPRTPLLEETAPRPHSMVYSPTNFLDRPSNGATSFRQLKHHLERRDHQHALSPCDSGCDAVPRGLSVEYVLSVRAPDSGNTIAVFRPLQVADFVDEGPHPLPVSTPQEAWVSSGSLRKESYEATYIYDTFIVDRYIVRGHPRAHIRSGTRHSLTIN